MDAPAMPSLFGPLVSPDEASLPPPTLEDSELPVPFRLRLPRTGVLPAREIDRPLPSPQYQLSEGGIGLLPNAIPQGNRWRIPFGQLQRYDPRLRADTPYQNGPLRFFDPYKASLLKGDSPIIGQNIFFNVTFEEQFLAEFRRVPVGSGVSAARANSTDFFGRSESYTLSNNLSATLEIFKGETAFKPVDWAIRVTPIFNINFTETKETNVLNPDPRGPNYSAGNPSPDHPPVITNPGDVGGVLGNGLRRVGKQDFGGTRYTQRTRETVSLEEAFLEIHLRDLSDNYDFVSARVGNQFLNADFRGFVFDDTDSGIRVFGNYDNNRLQYNAAFFNLREKDTFSGLNQYSARGEDVFMANVFRQDALSLLLPVSDPLALGYTAELLVLANLDHGEQHFDKNGFLVRPAPVGGPIVEHDVNSFYLGWTGDGHVGWLNVTHAFYQVLGHDDKNPIAGHGVDINAQMAAVELSIDHDYLRPKFSLFYASGDRNPRDKWATGFDSILDNPTFIGSPFSFYARQGFGLAGSSVLTKPANSLLLDLRTSKTEGQANFVNPGTLIVGVGLDADLTPRLKAQCNLNYIRFVDTAAIRSILLTNHADEELGYDLSLGFTYRPTLTQNIVINAGFGAFLPGRGYRDIYRGITRPVPGFSNEPAGRIDSFFYSGIVAITLTY